MWSCTLPDHSSPPSTSPPSCSIASTISDMSCRPRSTGNLTGKKIRPRGAGC
jgi:hypothetical protein